MIKLALIGHPLSHSLSKVIHEAAMRDLHIIGTYDLLDTEPENLINQVKYLKSQNYLGFNVTIPHKVPISLFLDKVDNNADIALCANTVKIDSDKNFYGYNTDIYGFQAALDSKNKTNLHDKKAAIIGAGGAARAVLISLGQLGYRNIDIYVRNIINASKMVNQIRSHFKDISFNLIQIENMNTLNDVQLLVNCTPVGMRNNSMDISPVKFNILSSLPKNSIVYDLIYNPYKTVLLKEAQNLGLKTINGLDMLIYQAQKAFEIWTGEIPDFKIMKIAALESMLENNI